MDVLHGGRRGRHLHREFGMLGKRESVGVLCGTGNRNVLELTSGGGVHGQWNPVVVLHGSGDRPWLYDVGLVHGCRSAVALLHRSGCGKLLEFTPGCDVHERRSAGAVLQQRRGGKLLEPPSVQAVRLGERLY